MISPWTRAAASILNLVYPPRCACCERAIDVEETNRGRTARLCAACRDELDFWTDACCMRCGAAVGPNLEPPRDCSHCRGDRFAFTETVALGRYQNKLRQAILAGKRSAGEPLLGELASCLLSLRGERLREQRAELVVPVPQHWRTRLWRAYNSAEVLATRISSELRIPLSLRVLSKIRATPSQVSLTPTERRQNLRGAFRTRFAGRIAGKRILLVDDVLTTGSTAHRCAQTLKRAGAKEIFVAVIARGLG
jgi:ComF family protein